MVAGSGKPETFPGDSGVGILYSIARLVDQESNPC